MTDLLAEPTTALTRVEEPAPLRPVDDAGELAVDEVEEVLTHHDQRTVLLGVGLGALAGACALVTGEFAWAAPFLVALIAGVGGTWAGLRRRKASAAELGTTDAVVAAVEGQWSRAALELFVEDVRHRRWREILLRTPKETRVALAPRIHARLRRGK
ncbi:MAG: hypothetical protein IT383_20410 [Deltaproteobacteria bacterium]|nr:hypothetical protein [Deltaproteobacteria bacterium]